jgi:tetratricopeptide (TPR) repeat protein
MTPRNNRNLLRSGEEAMPTRNEDLARSLTPAEAAEYTEVYKKGCGLLNKHIDLHDREAVSSSAKEAEVREGIECLRRAVALQPGSWPAWWMIGKGHQALGDHSSAFVSFRQATRMCRENADLPRELALECLQLGKFAEAVDAARLSVRIDRSDPGLQANLALALLLAGGVDEALDQAEQAAARSPTDEINRNLLAVIREVKEGRRQRPRTLAELEG